MSTAAQPTVHVAGVDVFLAQKGLPRIEASLAGFELTAISNRGTKVWPDQDVRFELCDLFQCRFLHSKGQTTQSEILGLLHELDKRGFDFVHFEKLLVIDGKNGFSEAAGAG